MDRINVKEILEKNWCNLEPLKKIHPRDGHPGTVHDRLIASIKEIAEAVVDKCKEQAKLEYKVRGYFEEGETAGIDEKSIEDVKILIDYE